MKQIFKKDHKLFKVKDYIKSGNFFQLYKDNNSGIVWTFLDKNHNHESYYLSEKYIPHKEKKGFFGFHQEYFSKKCFLMKKLFCSVLFFVNGWQNDEIHHGYSVVILKRDLEPLGARLSLYLFDK